jgi:acyl-CoA thioester hydrolase
MNIHHHPLRVYYEDTDAAGIVYHASYIRFAERGRTEMLRAAGFEHAQILRDTGIAFAVVAMNIQYKAPAKLDELVTVRTGITKMGGASMEMQQDIYRDDKLLCAITVTLVCIDKDLKATKLPAEIRALPF